MLNLSCGEFASYVTLEDGLNVVDGQRDQLIAVPWKGPEPFCDSSLSLPDMREGFPTLLCANR